MGYTNETTHYGIPLPLGSDLTTPMDYSESAQKIDTDLFESKTDSTSALQKANQLRQDLSATNDEVTTVKGRVTTLEGTSVTQGQAILQNTQDIADVRADALDMICAVDEGTAQVASVAVAKNNYFRYNDVLYMATADIAIGDTIVPNTNCRATNVATELQNIEGGSTPTPIGEIEAEDVTFNDTLAKIGATDVQSAIVALKTLIDNIGGGDMPIYDYEHPLHTFNANNLSYTLNKDAYLVGSVSVDSGSMDVTIKNTVIATSNSYGVGSGFINVKVKSGSTITVTKPCPALHVYDVI